MNVVKIRCRYLRRNDEQCTAEAVDDLGEILLCQKHLTRTVQLLASRGLTFMPLEPVRVPARVGR